MRNVHCVHVNLSHICFPVLDDFRIFCGDLGNEVTDETLTRAFSRYPSFVKAKVVREKKTNKTRGYGFVSFRDPTDFVRAMREMNGEFLYIYFFHLASCMFYFSVLGLEKIHAS